jgi:hypothetical protein
VRAVLVMTPGWVAGAGGALEQGHGGQGQGQGQGQAPAVTIQARALAIPILPTGAVAASWPTQRRDGA